MHSNVLYVYIAINSSSLPSSLPLPSYSVYKSFSLLLLPFLPLLYFSFPFFFFIILLSRTPRRACVGRGILEVYFLITSSFYAVEEKKVISRCKEGVFHFARYGAATVLSRCVQTVIDLARISLRRFPSTIAK